VLDLDADRCADTVAAIRADGGDAVALGADMSDRAQVARALAKLRGQFGPVVILVNNAAITAYSPFPETSLEE
jgi:2-hydroxycyclohexanecarboxyl-CoA dehydrogenase